MTLIAYINMLIERAYRDFINFGDSSKLMIDYINIFNNSKYLVLITT